MSQRYQSVQANLPSSWKPKNLGSSVSNSKVSLPARSDISDSFNFTKVKKYIALFRAQRPGENFLDVKRQQKRKYFPLQYMKCRNTCNYAIVRIFHVLKW